MSSFFKNMIARHTEQRTLISPRLPGQFEASAREQTLKRSTGQQGDGWNNVIPESENSLVAHTNPRVVNPDSLASIHGNLTLPADNSPTSIRPGHFNLPVPPSPEQIQPAIAIGQNPVKAFLSPRKIAPTFEQSAKMQDRRADTPNAGGAARRADSMVSVSIPQLPRYNSSPLLPGASESLAPATQPRVINVKVTIGKIEVRSSVHPITANIKKPEVASKPKLSLDDYLKTRKGDT